MSSFKAYVYQDDHREIQKLVQQYPNIETGGDLFGLWENESKVIIQRFIGPGKNCERTSTSFHQDIEYLHRVGSLITTEEGLCNVGEWHSHHQIGMPEPSAADHRTVFSNMPHLGLERFVLFIASIGGKGSSGKKRSHDVKLDDIKLQPFLFLGSTRQVVKGDIKIIPGSNPHRLNEKAENEIKKGKASPPLKHREEGSGPRKPEKNKREEKSEKPKIVPTLKQQAKPRVETHGESGAKPPAQSSSDDESGGGKPQDDQQPRRRDQDQKTASRNREERGNQTQMRDGFNNENQSPNTSSAAPTGCGSQSPPTQSPPQRKQVRDASSQFGTAQAHGRGIQMNMPPTGGAYSSDQSPQRASYTQQTSQRSPRDRGYGAQHTNQAQAKYGSGCVPTETMCAEGWF